MKSFLRKTKASKSTIRRVEIIARKGFYRRRRAPLQFRRLDAGGGAA